MYTICTLRIYTCLHTGPTKGAKEIDCMADSMTVNRNKAGKMIDQRIHKKLIVINAVFLVKQRIPIDLSSTLWEIVLN